MIYLTFRAELKNLFGQKSFFFFHYMLIFFLKNNENDNFDALKSQN
jgi:hypothetical protein